MVVSLSALVLAVSCATSEKVVVKDAGDAVPPPQAPMSSQPPAMQSAPTSSSADNGNVTDKDLDTYKGDYERAKADYGKDSKDATKKDAYVKATDKYAYASMMATSLDRSVKYKQALHLYRESLQIDPTDKDAQNWINQIEMIYKSLGKPVPE